MLLTVGFAGPSWFGHPIIRLRLDHVNVLTMPANVTIILASIIALWNHEKFDKMFDADIDTTITFAAQLNLQGYIFDIQYQCE
ncbi:hypothetical protein BDZ45DRAFT_805674 [Acephala macrosclerotiorum]|nr:hypothetical protein BDZ45DRAFT_805674 [Acephala macrosclerotiorum]